MHSIKISKNQVVILETLDRTGTTTNKVLPGETGLSYKTYASARDKLKDLAYIEYLLAYDGRSYGIRITAKGLIAIGKRDLSKSEERGVIA